MRTMKRVAAATAVVSALTMTAACGSDSSKADASASPSQSSAAPSSSAPAAMNDVAANLAGPGCAAYAKAVPKGTGSVAGMAADPVAVAAGNNPLLKTLTAAVSGKVNPKVNLVDTLNGSDFTVFAPVDSAFAKIPKATLKTLSTPAGAKTLTTILTYHVVAGQMTPRQIAGKTLKTVEGENLKISGSPDKLKAQKANVICGGVKTANATVYLIDAVMTPPSMMKK
ncbi:MAG TPA: fasciclin domain-containing protein [Nocardioidaceae bacterium]|jgi:uncharacterized surface protein with fasciclin (FAS1) repeats|nr:fasciclin domain-containing protein [Nocardioidaceae bacterium]